MKERGILFQSWGVNAIRNMKPGVWPAEAIDPALPIKWQTRRVIKPQPDHAHVFADGVLRPQSGRKEIRCPYGTPGDGLWVREAWGTHDDLSNEDQNQVYYKADWGKPNPEWAMMPKLRLKPSIHMFRWASREDLVVKEVRVERVQDISEEDARAEGTTNFGCDTVEWFRDAWDAINAARGLGWEANPWVFVVSYMRKAK